METLHVTTEQAAKMLQVTPARIRQLVMDGKLTPVIPGTRSHVFLIYHIKDRIEQKPKPGRPGKPPKKQMTAKWDTWEGKSWHLADDDGHTLQGTPRFQSREKAIQWAKDNGYPTMHTKE